jgi:hypothetical protein
MTSENIVAQSPVRRISDLGAKVAATRIGISVAEYRRREANGERWCPRCASWQAAWPRKQQTYCRTCRTAYMADRSRDGITYVNGAGS